MDDEIDIEEHDVLDNPRLRIIFPDLAQIKTEIPDNDFDVPDNLNYNSYSTTEGTPHDPDEEYTRYHNKIILGSKPNTNAKPVQNSIVFGQQIEVKQEVDGNVTEEHENVEENADQTSNDERYAQSVIILGTKPNNKFDNNTATSTVAKLRYESDVDKEQDDETPDEDIHNEGMPDEEMPGEEMQDKEMQDEEAYESEEGTEKQEEDLNYDIKDSVVALEDWGPILENSLCYCKKCEILFPTTNTLQAHNMTAHSFLVALEVNKAVKSTAKKTVSKPGKFCNHCNKTFPDSDTLISHLYESLTFDKNKGVFKSVNLQKPIPVAPKSVPIAIIKAPTPVDDMTVATTSKANADLVPSSDKKAARFYRCPVCYVYFKQLIRYTNHMTRHGIDKPKVNKVPYDPICFFCKSPFAKYTKHVARVHKNMYYKKVDSNYSKTGFEGRQDSKKLGESKKLPVASQNFQEESKGVTKYQCKKCFVICNSYFGASTHRARYHPETRNLPIFSKIKMSKGTLQIRKHFTSSKAIKSLPLSQMQRYQCLLCSKIFKTYDEARKHRRLAHPETKNLMIFRKLESKMVVKAKSPLVQKNRSETISEDVNETEDGTEAEEEEKEEAEGDTIHPLIPKSVLFLCRICQLHFTTSASAIAHLKLCNEQSYKLCEFCKRKLNSSEALVHQMQHRISNEFNVYSFTETSLAECVLNQCPSCQMYFYDKQFWSHIKDCSENPDLSIPNCANCKVCVHESCVKEHRKWHKGTNNSAILVKYQKTVQITKPSKRKLGDPGECAAKKRKTTEDSKLVMYYCETCKVFLKRLQGFHLQGKCKENKYRNTICTQCGLMVNPKHHRLFHFLYPKVTILDIKFYSMTNLDQRIVPPIPEYRKCNKCQTHFCKFSSVSVHSCKDVHKTCKYCNERFSDLAHKLHVRFHEYAITYALNPDTSKAGKHPTEDLAVLLKKYEMLSDTWNILYRCETCDTACDNYDKAVEHAQRHYINTENLGETICHCEICNLNFGSVSYNRHKDLHDQNSKINRSHFKIVTYDYNTLLSPSWMDMFRQLDETQVRQIISKSIYSRFRGIKMRVVKAGPSGRVLYKCMRCEAFCALQHAYLGFCKKDRGKPMCKICKRYFTSKSYKDDHQKKHNGTDNYKIVYINEKKDEELNAQLRIAAKYCLRRQPVKTHKVRCVAKNDIIHGYKCRHCQCCMFTKKAVRNHTCAEGVRCPQCKQLFRSNAILARHVNFHKNPRFNIKNMRFTLFPKIEDNVIELYKCECGLHFTSKKASDKHLEMCNKNSKVSKEKCSKCSRLFDTTQLFIHLCNHHAKIRQDTIYRVIDVAPQKTPQKIQKVQKRNKIFKCFYCEGLFVREQNLKGHNCYSIKDIECGKCGLQFKDLDEHSKVHTNCDSLAEDYYNISILTPEKSKLVFKCKDCDNDVNYLNYDGIRYHFDRNHQISNMILNCDECGMKFTSFALSKHMRTHHGDVEFSNDYNVFNCVFVDKKVIYEPVPNVVQPNRKVVSKQSIKIARNSDTSDLENSSSSNGRRTRSSNRESELRESKANRSFESTIPRNILYKCNTCKFYFNSPRAAQIHNCNMSKFKCEICHYTFSKKSLANHKMVYHELANYSRADFVIKTYVPDGNGTWIWSDSIDDNDGDDLNTDRFELVSTDVSNEEIKKIESTDVNNAEIEKIDQELSQLNSVDLPTTEDDLETNIVKKEYSFKNALPKCIKCDVCYLSMGAFYYHIPRCHEDVIKKTATHQCAICNLKFSSISFAKHNINFHSPDKNEDIFVVPINVGKNNLLSRYVFQCKICLCVFDHRSESLVEHINRNAHFGMTRKCECCGHCVNSVSFATHVKNCYEAYKKWSRKDFVVLQQTDDTHFTIVSGSVTDDVKKTSHCEDKEYKDQNGDAVKKTRSNDDEELSNERATDTLETTKITRDAKSTDALEKTSYKDTEFKDANATDALDKSASYEENEFRDKNGKVLLFRCYCGTLYMNPKNKHMQSIDACAPLERTVNTPPRKGCTSCGLPFGMNMGKHVKKHHVERSLNRDDFRIIEKKEIQPWTCEKTGKEYKKLFRCDLCLNHTTSYVSLRHHRGYCKDKQAVTAARCPKCDLPFIRAALEEHLEHHAQKKFNMQDLEILDKDADQVNMVEETIHFQVNDSGDKSEPDAIADKISTLNQDLYTNELFVCSKCSLHFLTSESLDWHVKNSSHKEIRIHCSVCSLCFTPKVLSVHVFIHHDKLNFKTHEFYITSELDDKNTVDSPKPSIAAISEDTINDIAKNCDKRTNIKDNQLNDRSKIQSPKSVVATAQNDTMKRISAIESPESIKSLSKTDVSLKGEGKIDEDNSRPSTSRTSDKKEYQIGAADSSGASDDTVDEISQKSARKSFERLIKLYKCAACNVCFLTQQSCYKHTTKHVPLDAKNYIECKLCGYQFPIANTLSHHMVKHHQTPFNPEDVLIEEYHPEIIVQGTPKIDIYHGSDKVQSKLISTTTEKDSNVCNGSSVDID